MAGQVFISYRWGSASSDAVARLAAALRLRLGATIPLDVERRKIEGKPLREQIKNDLKGSDIIIIAIHPDWIEAIPRLHDPDDLVRLEIETALEFGLKAVPVLLNKARRPERKELPDSLHLVADLPAVVFGQHETYEASVIQLAKTIEASLPKAGLRAMTWFADNSPINVMFALMILGALLLFTSRALDIHTLHLPMTVDTSIDGRIPTFADINREVGVLMAWNWAVALVLITPIMFFTFANTLRTAKQLLDVLQFRKMIYYIDERGVNAPLMARRLWEAVARPSSIWCQAFAAIAVVLGTYQWWYYSGQFHFKPQPPLFADFLKSFMQFSTGPDWNIAWALFPALASEGDQIAVFSLLMYLVYGIGSMLTYSYYAFLFNFFAELSQLATSADVKTGTTLRLDVRDRDSGGLGAFKIIQRDHAAFCLWTLLAMYLMALRNAYLPLVCRIPAGVVAMLGGDDARLAQCSSMPAFASNIYYSMSYFGRTLFSGHADLSVLVHTYSEQNPFILGSALYVCFIASFFFLISSRMKSIVQTARDHGDPRLADNLLKRIRFENGRVMVIMTAGALSIVFLNLGLIVVALALILFPAEYVWSRVFSKSPRQVAEAT